LVHRKALRPASATTEPEPQDGDFGRIASLAISKSFYAQAISRAAPVNCIACGKRVKRKGRKQKYCSRRCRQRDYWNRRALAKISAVVTHHTARSTTPPKSSSKSKGLPRQKSLSTVSFSVPLNLLGRGSWRWPGTTQLDATTRAKIVRCEIGGTFRRQHAGIPGTGGFE
jgi:endogenous inhibitor of DNA gyrase (YacG/DUF329 family)